VVVDQGRKALGKTIEVSVTSVLQTTAGKMIFCRWAESVPLEDNGRRERTGNTDRFRAVRDYRGPERREGERTDRIPIVERPAAPVPPPAPPAPEPQAVPAPEASAADPTPKPS
jgi:hypothetical protein